MNRTTAAILAVVAATAAVPACNESPSAPGKDVPTAVAKVAGDSQAAIVNTAVALAPSVRVTGRDGRPVPGVEVAFEVTAGDGSVSGATDTTDAAGIATAGGWMLGRRAGPNTLVATVGDLTPVVFTATGTAGPPASLTAVNPLPLSGIVGAAVQVRPTVRAADGFNNPVQGVPVTFAIGAGSGTATGTGAVTDSLGLAAVGGWTLGTVAGQDSMTATAPGLPPLEFLATAAAGAPASASKLAGDGQTAAIGAPVDTAPGVVVRDAWGNPVPGVGVAFSIVSGGGAVGGAKQTTNAAGMARVGFWTLGPGPNLLAANVAGLPVVSFSAAVAGACPSAPTPYAVGSTINGALSGADCRYVISLAGATSVQFSMASTTFYSRVNVYDSAGTLVAQSPFYCGGGECDPPTTLRVLLPAGTVVADASGFTYDDSDNIIAGAGGNFSLSSSVVPQDVTGCAAAGPVFIVPGVTTAQRIDTTDCAAPFRASTFYSDQIDAYLTAGRTYTIAMSSSDFDTYLELWQANPNGSLGGRVASNDDFGGTTDSRITFTPTQTGVYVIVAGTHDGDKTGTYTLTEQ